jgi:hypothetical protein
MDRRNRALMPNENVGGGKPTENVGRIDNAQKRMTEKPPEKVSENRQYQR